MWKYGTKLNIVKALSHQITLSTSPHRSFILFISKSKIIVEKLDIIIVESTLLALVTKMKLKENL
jgi:hypothetical protein